MKGRKNMTRLITGKEGPDILDQRFRLAPKTIKHFLLADTNTVIHCLPEFRRIVPSLEQIELIIIPAGEKIKNLNTCKYIWERLSDGGANRDSILVNLGGGVVTDIGGFAASAYFRGINYINVPTSLLAMIDAAIGAKTGVDLGPAKNQVGTFYGSESVLIYPQFLSTLPPRQLSSGFAEMLKIAIVSDVVLWKQLRAFGTDLKKLPEKIIIRSATVKMKIVAKDPLEQGLRSILNFGHTIGHAIESLGMLPGGLNLTHGEAVAAGMICECYIARELGILDQSVFEEVTSVVCRHTPVMGKLDKKEFFRFIGRDKKRIGEKIVMSIISDVGKPVINTVVTEELCVEALDFYLEFSGCS